MNIHAPDKQTWPSFEPSDKLYATVNSEKIEWLTAETTPNYKSSFFILKENQLETLCLIYTASNSV